MTSVILSTALAGAFGGFLRGLVGIAKSVVTKKDFKMNWVWFFISIAVSAILGMIAASFFSDDFRLAVLAGYAGSDFIEGLMKIKLKDRFENKAAKGFGELLEKAK